MTKRNVDLASLNLGGSDSIISHTTAFIFLVFTEPTDLSEPRPVRWSSRCWRERRRPVEFGSNGFATEGRILLFRGPNRSRGRRVRHRYRYPHVSLRIRWTRQLPDIIRTRRSLRRPALSRHALRRNYRRTNVRRGKGSQFDRRQGARQ